uniref:Amiloride-sensitive sodium channel n=1 Tax=Syphacia muris TaxID=451379 RepID=A0A0N5ATV6_9BILA
MSKAKHFQETTTFHGVRDFFVAQSWGLKMLWLITVIVAVIFAAHGSYSIFSEYSARPVVVSYFVQDAGSLPLPDILICPFNRYNRTFLEMHNVSESLAQYLEMSYPGTVIHQFQAQKYSIIKKQAAKLDEDLQQLLMRLGNITFKEFVEMAALDCTAFFEDKSVCKTVTAAMSSVGKCFRVYGGDQQGNGYGNGKRLVLKVPTHLYHAGVNNMINDGLAVKLAERSRGADRDLTFIPTGVHALMPLSATRYEFMSDPPRYMCLEKADDNYSNLWCFEVCLTEIPEDKCNCSLAASTIMRKDAICTYKQFVDCFMPTIRANGPAKIMKKCKNKCKAPCSYWSYQKTISYARFPAHHHRSLIDNDTEWEELHNRIILEVFYTSLDHTVIKHLIAMTPSSFIAQIGGGSSCWH